MKKKMGLTTSTDAKTDKRKQFQLFISTFTCAGAWPKEGSPTRQEALEGLGIHLFSFHDCTQMSQFQTGTQLLN